jgi:CRP-like cAMP-binding protein
MKKADPLQKIPLFNHLTKRERCKIADEMVEARYGKGQFIFREGDPADSFHILKEGSVKCVKTSPDAKPAPLMPQTPWKVEIPQTEITPSAQ